MIYGCKILPHVCPTLHFAHVPKSSHQWLQVETLIDKDMVGLSCNVYTGRMLFSIDIIAKSLQVKN